MAIADGHNEQCTIFAQTERSSQIHLDDAEVQPKITQKRSGCVMKNVQWKKVKLGDLISDSYAGGTPNRARNDYFGGDIPWVSSGEVNNPIIDSTIENITQVGLNNSSARWIPENSILLALYGATAGQVSMLKIRATANQAVLAIIPNNEVVDTRFLFYQIFHNKQSLLFLAQGSGQPNLSKSIVDRLDISYPDSLPAQRRIAAILSTADKVIEQTRQLIGKYKSIKQGMMEDLLKPKEGWKKVKLGDIGKISMCKRIFSFETTTEGEIPFYKIGTFGKTADAFISRQLYEEYKSKFSYPKVGDILISASGTIGRTVVYDGEPAYFQDSNIIWIDNDEQIVVNEYLYYLYMTISWNLEGSTIARLYNDNFNRIEISVPDLLEQHHIAKRLAVIDKKIEAEEKVLEKYEKMKKGLMERLLNE